MTFEPHPREFFSPSAAPARLSTLREKLIALFALGVDEVSVVHFNAAFAGYSMSRFAEEVLRDGLKAKEVRVGHDFRFGAERAGDCESLAREGERLGFSVRAIPKICLSDVRVSSSAVRAALKAGDLAWAETLLGRPYSVSGRVGRGQRLGRSLGFATANIVLRHIPLPLSGVFVALVRLPDGSLREAVVNVGVRPTLGAAARPLLEAHLIDFQGDLYGVLLTVEFIQKLREEMKFSDLAALKARIAQDVCHARDFFAAKRYLPTQDACRP
jgi:riboflavin kinase/FMN adenylyltransferase